MGSDVTGTRRETEVPARRVGLPPHGSTSRPGRPEGIDVGPHATTQERGRPHRDLLWAKGHLVISLGAGLAVWQLLSLVIPSDVSSPATVWQVLIRDLLDGVLLTNATYSILRVAVGFVIGITLAVPTAFLLNSVRPLRYLVDPWLQFARMIPPIALIPLVIVFFGIGELAKVSVIAAAVFFVSVITCYQGIRMIDAVLIRAGRVLGAKGVALFWRVTLPAALPAILTAARLGIATGWTTLVAAELIAASHGLGFMITQAGQYFDLPTVYLGIGVIGLLGLGMDRLVVYVDRRLIGWADVTE